MGSPGPQRGASGAAGGRLRCPGCGTLLATDNTAHLCGRCHREQRDQLRTPPQPRDEFFETDEFRAAFESQHIGKVLRAYRYHPRHLQLLGKALNQEVLGRWLHLTQAQVSKLENGKAEQNLETLQSYARILHLPQHLLWFDLPGQTRIAARLSGDGFPEFQLTPSIPSLAQPSLQIPSPLDSLPPFRSTLASGDPELQIRRMIDARAHFERMYRNAGGLVTGARIELFLARQALPMPASFGDMGGVERKSRRAIGSLIALAGVCAYDSEDWNAANSHFARALAIAEMFRDYSFHAYVLALMANQALALEDYKAAERLANVGLLSSARTSAVPLTVDLQMMRVKALAAMGEGSTAMPILHELELEISKLPSDSGIAEANYAQEGHLQAGLAEALTSLGDLKAAQRHAEQSLRFEGHAKGKVNRLASLATLEVARGEIERASFLACKMIDSAQGMESRRLRSRFAKIRTELANRPMAASRDAIDRLDTALALML